MMHTNGGDKWIVYDKLLEKEVEVCRSQVKAYELCDSLNIGDDSIHMGRRYSMKRYDEANNRTIDV